MALVTNAQKNGLPEQFPKGQVILTVGRWLESERYKGMDTLITALPKTRLVKRSSLYESEPIGDAKNWYVNGVVEVETDFAPDKLLTRLQAIEKTMGRKKTPQTKKWASRKIDLDILLFDNYIVDSRSLKIPHPEIPHRPRRDSIGFLSSHK